MVAPEKSSSPQVRVRVKSRLHFEDGSFCPLSLPTALDAVFLEPQKAAKAVERFEAHVTCSLLPGEYEFAFHRERPLLVRVPENFKAEIHVSCARVPSFATPVVTGLEMVFLKPLQLDRVLPTLFVLPRMVDDRDIAFLRDFARRMGVDEIRKSFSRFAENLAAHLQEGLGETGKGETGKPEWLSFLFSARKPGAQQSAWWERLGALADPGENGPHIYLHRVDALPRVRSGRAEMDLAFSGEIGWEKATLRRFDRVVLPQTVIPALHGELGRLLGPEPASSAVLRMETVDSLELARPAARMLSAVEGAWKIVFADTHAQLEAHLHDHARLQIDVSMAPMTIAGGIHARVEGNAFRGVLPKLEIMQENRKTTCEMAFFVESADLHPCEAAVLQSFGRDADAGYTFEAHLHPDSSWGAVQARVSYRHPYIKGALKCPLRLDNTRMDLDLELHANHIAGPWEPRRLRAAIQGDAGIPGPADMNDGRTRVEPHRADGRVAFQLEREPDGVLQAHVQTHLAFAGRLRQEVDPLPELGLTEKAVHADVEGQLHLDARIRTAGADPVTVTLDGSSFLLDLSRLELTGSGYSFAFPAGLLVRTIAHEMYIDTTGTGRTRADVFWDLRGKSPVLSGKEHRVEVFVPELRQGNVQLEITPLGHLEIRGLQAGLYDAHFWNALVNPGEEPRRWLEILLSDSAMEKVIGALSVFHMKAADALAQLRQAALRARDVLQDMGVKQPGDFLPAERIAEFAARLTERDTLSEWHAIVLKAVTGHGVDILRVRRLLLDALPEHEHHFELDRALRIANLLVTPTEPVPPRVEREQIPVARRPEFSYLHQLPAASDIDSLARDPHPHLLRAAAAVAHYLTREQLQHLMAIPAEKWTPADAARIKIIAQIKDRMAQFGEYYGGVGYILQPWAVSFFLGQAVTADLPGRTPPLRFDPGPHGPWSLPEDTLIQGLLGPHDIAVLLQCTLSAALPTRTVQINRHMLLSLLARGPAAAVRQVLCALSGNSPRILAHALYGLFNQSQDLLREPVDAIALVEHACGVPMPRQEDFLAQGAHAMDSYYHALWEAADALLRKLTLESALFAHLRESRREPPALVVTDAWRERVRKAIGKADAVSARCTFSARENKRREQARKAHEQAVHACREWFSHEPCAFSDPLARHYMARHFEALQVLSVVRNYQQDIDRVRPWVHHRTGRKAFDSEQDLLHAVTDALYYDPQDAQAVREDPLVRLLWDPPEIALDFAVISCMGVITEGARGTELAETFARLQKRRGVTVVRADTQTSRSLEFNADRIIEAVQSVRSPYGLLGYSQGCANALCAEARMLAGPPQLQELASRLRGRQFLFSAINGSAHGTCGEWKLHRTMVEIDRFMKHYQGIFSGTLIRFFLQNLNALLYSRAFVQGFGGMASLSYEGVETLAREGQFCPSVPTCILRGIVSPQTLPEALMLLSNALSAQLQDERHDTQVQVDEAVGHFRYVRNPWTDVLRDCDIGCRVQAVHHWSPLLAETAFITTARDCERCIYDIPKDRHVFPWVDLLHRFGFISPKAE